MIGRRTYIVFFVIAVLGYSHMGYSQPTVNGQLLKKGRFAVEYIDVQETNNIIPPLTSDEGVIRLIIDPTMERYFTLDEVLSWIRNNQLRIPNVNFEANNVVIRPDGSIGIRFMFRFIPNTSKINRRIQIQNVKDFETYFQTHELFQQKMVTYRLKVQDPPVYDTPKTGTIIFNANKEDFTIEVLDLNNNVRKFTIPDRTGIISLVPGNYTVTLQKTGHFDIKSNISVVSDSTVSQAVLFRMLNVQGLSTGNRSNRKSRWWLWTSMGVIASSVTGYYLYFNNPTQLPAPPGPPDLN